MKVGEARGLYSSVLKEYNEQKNILSKRKSQLQERIKNTPDGEKLFAQEAATLELSYNAVSEKYDEYRNYMEQVMDMWSAKVNQVSAEQQGEAVEEGVQELSKIMTVARRIMHGDIVPASDERKLMEYDSDLYQMAKNAGMLAQLEKKKKYDTLWDDETDKENVDAIKEADSQEMTSSGPEIVSAESVISAVTGDTEG